MPMPARNLPLICHKHHTERRTQTKLTMENVNGERERERDTVAAAHNLLHDDELRITNFGLGATTTAA